MRVGDANRRFRLVVMRHQYQIVAHRFESFDRLFHRELRAELDMLAKRRLLAGERPLDGDLDFALLRPLSTRHGGDQRDHKN